MTEQQTQAKQYNGLNTLLQLLKTGQDIHVPEESIKTLEETVNALAPKEKQQPGEETEEPGHMSKEAILEALTHHLDAPHCVSSSILEAIWGELHGHLAKPGASDIEFLGKMESMLKIQKWIPERLLYPWLCHRKHIAADQDDYSISCHRRLIRYLMHVKEGERLTWYNFNTLEKHIHTEDLVRPAYTVHIRESGGLSIETRHAIRDMGDYMTAKENKGKLGKLGNTLSILCQLQGIGTPIELADALTGIVDAHIGSHNPHREGGAI